MYWMPSGVPVKATSSSSSEIQTSSQRCEELDAALQRIEVHRGESEALGGGVEEIVAVRILDEVLARILDGRLVRAFASEIVRQIEWLMI